MPAIIVPGRAAKGKRPHTGGRVVLNTDSNHRTGLIHHLGLYGQASIETIRQSILNNTSISPTANPLVGVGSGFNGSSSIVQTASAYTGLNGLEEFTVSAWCSAVNYDRTWNYISGVEDTYGSGRTSYLLRVQEGSLYFYMQDDLAATATAPAVMTTFHVAGRYRDDRQMAIFVNGVLGGTTTGPTSTPSTTVALTLGDSSTYSGRYWQGLIADHRIYNRALSDDEVWSLYDPATRWDLYWVPGRVFFDVGAAGARLSRLSLLGVG